MASRHVIPGRPADRFRLKPIKRRGQWSWEATEEDQEPGFPKPQTYILDKPLERQASCEEAFVMRPLVETGPSRQTRREVPGTAGPQKDRNTMGRLGILRACENNTSTAGMPYTYQRIMGRVPESSETSLNMTRWQQNRQRAYGCSSSLCLFCRR